MIDKQLALHTIGHFSIDAICAAVIFRHVSDPMFLYDPVYYSDDVEIKKYTLMMFILLSIISFAFRPLAGIILDRKPLMTEYVSWSFVFPMVAVLPFLNIWIKIFLLGIGNCLFHAAAGSAVVKKSSGKAAPLGVFIAGGGIGTIVGMTFGPDPLTIPVLLVLLAAMLALSFEFPDTVPLRRTILLPPINRNAVFFLSLCLLIRSFFDYMPFTELPKTNDAVYIIIFGAIIGKFVGGFLADKFSIRRTITISLIWAAIIAIFIPATKFTSLWSVVHLLMTISIPVTVFLMCKAMPGRPSLAIGWAAACTLPGMIAPDYKFTDYSSILVMYTALFVTVALILLASKEVKKTDDMLKLLSAVAAREKQRKLQKINRNVSNPDQGRQ